MADIFDLMKSHPGARADLLQALPRAALDEHADIGA